MSREVVEVTCGPLVAGGDALVRREGQKVLFVEGGIPGEKVRAEIHSPGKDLDKGHVVEVLDASPHRISSPDVLLPLEAGGAEWQHIDAAAQHDYKIGIVTDALTRIAKLPNAPIRFAGTVSDTGYRTTMRLGVIDGKAAMRQRHSNTLVPLTACKIAHPRLEELILGGDFGTATEVTLRVSATTGERVAFVRGDVDSVKLPSDVHITPNGRNASITESVNGRRFRVSARSFFQSGQQAAELLSKLVDEAVPEDAGWIIDAYAGIGLLGGVVGEERDAQITAVEQDHSAVLDARHNLSDLAAEIIEAEVATVALASESNPDVVIADPSRTGLGKSASRTLAGLGASTFVLVSCDPASLARDTNLLIDAGYQLDDVAVLDLFPHSPHVETVSTYTQA